MATDEWEEVIHAHHGEKFLRGNHVTRDEVLVRVAHARDLPIDQYFIGFWFVNFDFLDDPWLVHSVQNGCT